MKNIIKILAIVLLFGIVFVFTSCGEQEQIPKGMIKISSDFIDYKLYVPDSWTEDISNGFVSAYASDKSNISIQTMSLSGVFENSGGYMFYVGNNTYSSIDEYFKNSYAKDLESTFAEYKLVEEYTTNQKFGNSEKCAKYVYTINTNGITYKFMQIFTISGGNMYIFTFTAAEDNFDSHVEEVNKIITNFSF